MTIFYVAMLWLGANALGQAEKAPPAPSTEPAAKPAEAAKTDDTPTKVRYSKLPYDEGKNDHYVSNKAPLRANPLIELPIGQILPREWVEIQFRLFRDNFYGHLPELSEFLKDDSGWLDPEKPGWEEAPYWLRGFGDLGFAYKDIKVGETTKRWIDKIIESQQPDGYFGPKQNRADKDYWPNMLILDALRSRHEATNDERIIPFMQKYFRFRFDLPADELYPFPWGKGEFKRNQWQHARAGDEIDSVYWLYNRTGEKWLLELADRMFKKSADWTGGVASDHGVNIAHGFRTPAQFYQQTNDSKHLEATLRNYKTVYDEFGQVPGGMFAADEHTRKGFAGPQQAAETCTMVEMMRSFEMLVGITGDVQWADKCEDVLFNSFNAAISPDVRGVRYLTAPNMVQCDKADKHPGFYNKGMMLPFDPKAYRCCLHNSGVGYPDWTRHLWFATPGNGLAAVMYAPCEVRAKVGSGVDVSVAVATEYPFGETVEFKLSTPKPVEFPLSVRIPGWCKDGQVTVNGEVKMMRPEPGGYVIIERTWKDGDTVKLSLPMELRIQKWAAQNDAVSIHRGPLAYSMRLQEDYTRSGDKYWATYEVATTDSWNYALSFDPKNLSESFTVLPRTGVKVGQIFYTTSAPHTLQAKGYKVPNWTLDKHGLPGTPEKSPIKFDAVSPEEIELIPMGCARLRISVFSVATTE